MTCSRCKEGKYKEVDRETNHTGKTYLLYECDKCSYTIIIPETKRDKKNNK